MLSVLASRLGQAVLVMLVVTGCRFLMFRYVGDPVAIMSREDATQEEKQELRRSLGLDRPSTSCNTADSSDGSLTGDLGISYRNQRPVTELIAERLPATMELVFVATILSLALGIPLGVLCALQPERHAGAPRPGSLAHRHFDADIRDRDRADPGLRRDLGWLPSFGRGQVVRISAGGPPDS